MDEQRRRFFESHASTWDKRFYHITSDQDGLDRHCALYEVKKGQAVLDIGCGTGIMFGRLKKCAGPRGRVVGLDFSHAMISRAKAKYRGPASAFVCGDAHRLPFANGSFDRIVCFSCFPHFRDKKKAVREAARVLKQGGMLVISHLCSSRKIASIHRSAGAAVSKDFLPSQKAFRGIIRESGMELLAFRDAPRQFLVKMRKP